MYAITFVKVIASFIVNSILNVFLFVSFVLNFRSIWYCLWSNWYPVYIFWDWLKHLKLVTGRYSTKSHHFQNPFTTYGMFQLVPAKSRKNVLCLQQTTIKISSMRFKPSRKNIPRYFNGFQYSVVLTKQTFTCSKSTVENLEKEVKYVQS